MDNSSIFVNVIELGKAISVILLIIIEYVYFRNWIDI
jgi:hypothetical protein